MFCKNCGQKISDQQNFCEFCGATSSSTGRIYSVRDEQISLIDDIISFFSQKKELYDEYDKVTQRINNLKFTCARAALIWGIILSAVMTVLSLTLFISLLSDGENPLYALIPFSFVLAGGALIFLFVARNKKRRIALEIAINQYSKLSEELSNHYAVCENCPVGIEYTNPSTLLAIKKMIQSGRADTIKEAINVLLDDAHRRKMEDLAVKTAQYVESNYKLSRVAVIASIADLLD